MSPSEEEEERDDDDRLDENEESSEEEDVPMVMQLARRAMIMHVSMLDFTDETVNLMIAKHLDHCALLVLGLSCKRFKKLILDTPAIWRDAWARKMRGAPAKVWSSSVSMGVLRQGVRTPVYVPLLFSSAKHYWVALNTVRQAVDRGLAPDQMVAVSKYMRRAAGATLTRGCIMCHERGDHLTFEGVLGRLCSLCLTGNMMSSAELMRSYGINFFAYIDDLHRANVWTMRVANTCNRRKAMRKCTWEERDFAFPTVNVPDVFMWKPHLGRVFDLEQAMSDQIARNRALATICAKIMGMLTRLMISKQKTTLAPSNSGLRLSRPAGLDVTTYRMKKGRHVLVPSKIGKRHARNVLKAVLCWNVNRNSLLSAWSPPMARAPPSIVRGSNLSREDRMKLLDELSVVC